MTRRRAPFNASLDFADALAASGYHHGDRARSTRKPPPAEREFIAWDGEGARDAKRPRRQNYVLLGTSEHDKITAENLRTADMLAFIIEMGRKYPGAFHVAFAFDYDANMILRNLTTSQFKDLRANGHVYYEDYRIEHIPHKWFQVTQYGPNHDTNKRDKITVRIADMFGFFQSSFIKALKNYIPNHPLMARLDIIEQGKAARNDFTYDMIDFITEYWSVEIDLMRELANTLREMLYDVGLNIKQWHGPGALANFAYSKYGIKQFKAECPAAVYDAARYGYAGGRFERFHIGRFTNGFGYDINSAYPFGISKLPDLVSGYWRYNERPTEIVEFGIYHVRLRGAPVASRPSPLFHRDEAGNISYPWLTDGWYWSPEVACLRARDNMSLLPEVEIIEGWEYVDFQSRPFEFVADIYNQRREMKRLKIGSEKALKLLLNSLYGKMAQRVGWERSGKAPTWHQLEWAGWVTSYTRAMLYHKMRTIPLNKLIAVETDGLYTTATPKEMGITDSKELGGWEVTPFEEIRYVQSGMYAVQHDTGEWTTKYRGLDNDSITPESLKTHLEQLHANADLWPMLSGPTTRFVGYRQALWRQDMNMGPMKIHHCNWETNPKDLSAGSAGKRVHSRKLCEACQAGANAWEMPHGTVIRSRSIRNPVSSQHDIPWIIEDQDAPEWRAYQESIGAA